MARAKKVISKRVKALDSQYYDASKPGSFAGAYKLRAGVVKANKNKRVKFSRKHVNDFLSEQDTHTLHKKPRRHFTRRRTWVGEPYLQWQVDLVDMREFEKDNRPYKWIVMCIDCFTKYAVAAPLVSKANVHVVEAFKKALDMIPREQWPKKIQSDKGSLQCLHTI
jgi:hypothetical protein